MAAPTEDCCGLGCNNCILDRYLDNCARRPDFKQKFNLFNQKGYQKFKLTDIKKERNLVYQFTFELVCDRGEPFKEDEQLLATPVSYLMLRAARNFDEIMTKPNAMFDDVQDFVEQPEDESVVYYRSQPQRFDKGTPEIFFSRKYTPFEVNEQLRTFKILVKLEQHGRMSNYLTRLHVGSVCEFKGPFEAFNYIHEEIENFIVVTQGISILSAFRLVKEIVYESAQTRILVVSCFKNLNETFLREDFFKLTHFWNLKHHTFLSQNVDPLIPSRCGEKIHNERLNSENFRQLMRELKFFDPERTQVLLSGRDSFIEAAKSIVAHSRYTHVATI